MERDDLARLIHKAMHGPHHCAWPNPTEEHYRAADELIALGVVQGQPLAHAKYVQHGDDGDELFTRFRQEPDGRYTVWRGPNSEPGMRGTWGAVGAFPRHMLLGWTENLRIIDNPEDR